MLADYDKILTILQQCATDNVHNSETQLKQLASKDVQVLTCLQLALKDHRLRCTYVRVIGLVRLDEGVGCDFALCDICGEYYGV